jgi:hypothetical protein
MVTSRLWKDSVCKGSLLPSAEPGWPAVTAWDRAIGRVTS